MGDQMLTEQEACNSHKCCNKCLPWSGIIAGALIAVGLSFLLSVFGAAINLSAFHTSPEGATTLAIGGYIGLIIGTIAVMYLAGWVAGYLGRRHCYNQNLGALYGFTAWCLAFIIMMVIATQAMQFVSARVSSITNSNVNIVRLFNNVMPMMNDSESTKSISINTAQANVNDEEAAKLLAQALFLTFALFFIGAMSSALGGYCGVKTCCNDNKMCCTKR